ncbi:endolytic transglycosylase MltG [uncultured Polaribacter sp.]|uniref:endolytic transglycosylase MltG n=1 Tax=uncultured Polaribacter sp. TaxID=174711 RepID=UPI0026239C6F|nr:endolytic transglycosylase MltG [uncultured Polaribacter sp.]
MNKKNIFRIVAALFLVACMIGFTLYQRIFSDNVLKDGEIFIGKSDTMAQLDAKIAPFLEDFNSFTWVKSQKKFKSTEAGRYLIKKGMSNNDIVNMLRIGRQTPLKVSFNNQDTLEKFVERIAEQLETDSISLMNAFKNEKFLKENDLTEKSVLQIFIPNTYEFYWTVSAEDFRTKMLVAYKRFWNKSRLEKAKKLNLSKDEVIILASIVQKETAQKSEKPTVAGLYLNRLKKGWPLQADPTVIYVIKEQKGQDYVVKRVLNVDLEINSPYNTYKNTGLPPTLISMPDQITIDAVLNAEDHDYYYMCVNVEKLGYHAFAKTLAQHNRNAVKYHNWLNDQGVNR